MKYKVGDKVKLRSWEDLVSEFGLCERGDIDFPTMAIVPDMEKYLGKIATISFIDTDDDTFYIKEDGEGYWYNENCIFQIDRLKIYDRVNSCETFEGLANIIRSLADEDGMIQGRTKKFNAEQMAEACMNFHHFRPNVLTREFGIRQQAMYINHYSK